MVDHFNGLEAPQFPFKKNGMKSGASDSWLTGCHRNRGIQDLQMKPPFVFVSLKVIPTTKIDPFPPKCSKKLSRRTASKT